MTTSVSIYHKMRFFNKISSFLRFLAIFFVRVKNSTVAGPSSLHNVPALQVNCICKRPIIQQKNRLFPFTRIIGPKGRAPIRIAAFLAPRIDRFQGDVPMGGATALALLSRRARRHGMPHYLLHMEGARRHELANTGDREIRIDLARFGEDGRDEGGAVGARFALLRPRLPQSFRSLGMGEVDGFLRSLAVGMSTLAGIDPRADGPTLTPLDLGLR